MSTECYKSFEPARWNVCLKLLCQPLENLNPVQRAAALVFHYYGRVQNGGHSSHFDSDQSAFDSELLEALRSMGANRQARILAEARFLKREADMDSDEEAYAWETIQDLDRQFCGSTPDIPELLARYFNAHHADFPK